MLKWKNFMKTMIITALTVSCMLLPVPAFTSDIQENTPRASTAQEAGECRTCPVADMPPMYYGRFLIDRFEYTLTGRKNKFISYEATGWYGGDYQRVYIEAEGVHDTGSSDGGEIERLDLLYGRLISPFWNIRAGFGYSGTYGPGADERFFAVLGLKGLAPYMFEIDTNFRISNRGEVLLDLEAEYDLYLTQRLVLQPRFDASFSFNRIEKLGIGPGFPDIGVGTRLRYEIKRQFAPYVGLSWSTMTGGSRDIARKEGEPRDVTEFMAGIRIWF